MRIGKQNLDTAVSTVRTLLLLRLHQTQGKKQTTEKEVPLPSLHASLHPSPSPKQAAALLKQPKNLYQLDCPA